MEQDKQSGGLPLLTLVSRPAATRRLSDGGASELPTIRAWAVSEPADHTLLAHLGASLDQVRLIQVPRPILGLSCGLKQAI